MRILCLALLFAASQEKDSAAEIARLQAGIEALAGGEVRREIDPALLASSLGHDPEKLFGFVRSLDFHPYRGVLRGAWGTLLAGGGNDLDRCLLLKDLLLRAPAAPRVRFAFGELSDEQAATLAARALKALPGRPSSGAIPKAAAATDLARARTRLASSSADHLARFGSGYGADRDGLEEALKGAGAWPVGRAEDGLAACARRLRDHAWLQVERDGRWIDLDPSFRDAAPGWAPTAPARTAEAPPPEVSHAVGLRILLERRNGDALESELLYAGRRPSADLAGRAVNVSVLPKGFDTSKFSGTLLQQAAKFERFQPVVDWGGASENGRVFDLQGRAHQSKNGTFAEDSGAVVGTRVLGGLGARAQPTAFAALRVELETISPGEAPVVESRPWLDRVDPAARARKKADWAGAWSDDLRFRVGLIQSWTLWTAPGSCSDAFLLDRLAGILSRKGGLPALLVEQVDRKREVPMGDVAARVEPLPLPLVSLGQNAALLAASMFAGNEGALYPDRPSLFLWKEALLPGEGNEVRWRIGVDLVSTPLGAVAKDPAAAAQARFTYGLLLSEAESALVEGRGRDVFSASAVFRRAREAKIPALVLRGRLEGVSLDARAEALVRRDLEAGSIVVIPREPVLIGGRKTTAWWRVDPATGACLGIGDTGEGQGSSEGVLILEHISIPMVKRCLKFVACLNVGVGVGGASLQSAGRECMVEFMKDYVKETVDAAVNQFIVNPLKEKATEAVKGGVRNFDPRLVDLYEKFEKYKEMYDEANGLWGLRERVELLLVMGQEVAEHAAKKSADFRNR